MADQHGHKLLDQDMVKAAGETDFAEVGRRYLEQTQWRAGGRPFYVDKLPPNFMLAGFIRRALPQARILHMVRDPMELCFSNYRALFGDAFAYSYDLDALAAHHAQYRRLMRHWHEVMPGAIHDVDYAALVHDPEAATRALLAHCGLPFEAGVPRYRQQRRPGRDAQQRAGARADPCPRVAAWQPYASQLTRAAAGARLTASCLANEKGRLSPALEWRSRRVRFTSRPTRSGIRARGAAVAVVVEDVEVRVRGRPE